MNLLAILVVSLVSRVAISQTTAKPVDTAPTRDAKPLMREEQKPLLWDSKLIRLEREGVIAPSILWPDERMGLKDFIRRNQRKIYADSVAIQRPLLLDTPPMYQEPGRGHGTRRKGTK